MRKYLLSQSVQTGIKMFSGTQKTTQLFQKCLRASVVRIPQMKTLAQKANAVKCVNLKGRTLLRVAGRDAKDLLQGLTTNDVELLTDNVKALYTMFLNNQGRILYDVICYRVDPGRCENVCYLLECDTAASQSLQKHLKMYRLRKKVDITLFDEAEPWAIYNGDMGEVTSDLDVKKSIVVQDPRIPGFGSRLLMHQSETIGELLTNFNIVDEADYQKHRFVWGVSEGISDLPPGDSLPLESNLAFMNGVSFSKGCYLGQELTARTHYTGVIRKRIMPVDIISSPSISLEPGASVKNEDGKSVGKFRSHIGENGLALVRVALSQNKKLIVKDKEDKDIEMQARIPDWWPNKEDLVIQ